MGSNDAPGRPPNPEEWSDPQWADWFREEVEPTDRWEAHVSMVQLLDPNDSFSRHESDKAFQELQALGQADETTRRTAELMLEIEPGPEHIPMRIGLVRWHGRAGEFSHLSQQVKLDFHRSWTQVAEPLEDSAADELSHIVVGIASFPRIDEDADAADPDAPSDVAVEDAEDLGSADAPYPDQAGSWGWQKWAAPIVVAGVITGWIVIRADEDELPLADATIQASAGDEVLACGAAAPPSDISQWTCTASLADDAAVAVTYPTTAQLGSPFAVRLCSQLDGELFATLGNDPVGPSASHASGTAGPDGCTQLDLDVPDPNSTTLWATATGYDAVVVDNAIVVVGGSDTTATQRADTDVHGDTDRSYTDPIGDMPEPALDVVGSTSGQLPDGRYWVLLEFAEPWPPGEEHLQWTVILRMYADGAGASLAESVTILHRGETQQPEAPIEQQAVDGGLLTIFADPGIDAELLYNWMVTRQVQDGEASRVDSDIPTGQAQWALDNVADPRA